MNTNEPGTGVRVKLGSGRVVEVVPVGRTWLPRFFLARENASGEVLMLHEEQVVDGEEGRRQKAEGRRQRSEVRGQ